jgi:hypothetical protein
MFSVIRLIDVDTADCGQVAAELHAAARTTSAHQILVQPTLPGSRNGGDILMHLRFAERSQWDSVAADFTELLAQPGLGRVNGATYSGDPVTPPGDRRPAAIYRTLLLRVPPETEPAVAAQFEADLRLLTEYVLPIAAWQLSRVDTATGTTAWTHVFEQEFHDLDGLMGPYLMHPIHWSYVDRWFDPECPEVIIRDRVCHSFCRCDVPVLT